MLGHYLLLNCVLARILNRFEDWDGGGGGIRKRKCKVDMSGQSNQV